MTIAVALAEYPSAGSTGRSYVIPVRMEIGRILPACDQGQYPDAFGNDREGFEGSCKLFSAVADEPQPWFEFR